MRMFFLRRGPLSGERPPSYSASSTPLLPRMERVSRSEKNQGTTSSVSSLASDAAVLTPSHSYEGSRSDRVRGYASTEEKDDRDDNDTLRIPHQEEEKRAPLVRRKSSRLHDIGMHIKKSVKNASRSVAEDESEFKKACREFCESTTLHGIPMVLRDSHTFVRVFWALFWLASLTLCIIQCTDVLSKFRKNDKLTTVKIEFGATAFPAVTVCNLNPYKYSLARSAGGISETLDAFHLAVTNALEASVEEEKARKRRDITGFKRNGQYLRRGFSSVQFEPVLSDCECKKGKTEDCIQKDSIPSSMEESCICTFDSKDLSAWPCYNYSLWDSDVSCPDCNDTGFCNLPNSTSTSDERTPCACNLHTGYCLLIPEPRMRRIFEFRGKKAPKKGSPFRAEFQRRLKDLGYENMTDHVAITTKTKAKLIMKMAALDNGRRRALGYGLGELIRMCSFNGLQCNISDNFKHHMDNAFGNCYTFSTNVTSSQAGPNNGLRLMVFANASDYLPTTDAVGVRIAIHGARNHPFPDTFGYSAPTGMVSSFGLSLKKMHRLNLDDCFSDSQTMPGYIFAGFMYESEGCLKSKYQDEVLVKCGCYDPRLPPPLKKIPSDKAVFKCTRDSSILCVEKIKQAYATNSSMRDRAECIQPCDQDEYTTTYSAATWPSRSADLPCNASDCLRYYRENAAMIEIYYERMSHEFVSESRNYDPVNVLSDIGGTAGLWLGASVLTAVEFMTLLLRLTKLLIQKYDMKLLRKTRKLETTTSPRRTRQETERNNNEVDRYQHL